MTTPAQWARRWWHDHRVHAAFRAFRRQHGGRPLLPPLPRDRRLRVCHVSPTYFTDESCIGGGERVPSSLARAMASAADVTLVSFGPKRTSRVVDGVTQEIFPLPSAWATFETAVLAAADAINGFDVVHCHQLSVMLTAVAARVGRSGGAHVFVTDHGGADGRAAGMVAESLADISGLLVMSEFSRRNMPPGIPHRVIHGGVDDVFLTVAKEVCEPRALFIGRITPHKGIDVLVDAMPPGLPLEIHGRAYHPAYLDLLRHRSAGKAVEFHVESSDADLRAALARASVLVLPSVHRDCFGGHHRLPELLGLVLLEAMATGTPVICSDVGGMPEIVRDGATGFVVPPGDAATLRDRLERIVTDPTLARRMGEAGRADVCERFTWTAVAARCLRSYAELSAEAAPGGSRADAVA
jgi:glycosyltransferase involved in cell wall biosynthesis